MALLVLGLIYPRPLTAGVEFPLLQSMSYFPYGEQTLEKKGEWSLRLDLHYSNIFMYNHMRSTLNDFEALSAVLGLRWGLWKKGTVEVYLRCSSIFPGVLDKFIEDFHDTFGLDDTGRIAYPRFAVHYWYKDYFSYHQGKTVFSPLVLGLYNQWLSAGDSDSSFEFSLNSRLALGIPLASVPGFSSDKPFLSTGVIMAMRYRKLALEFSNYLSFFKTPSWLAGERIHSSIYFFNFEARAFGFIGGLTFRTSAFTEGDIAHNAYQGYIGFRIAKGLELIILEDFAPFDTTPDIGFQLRVKLPHFGSGSSLSNR